MGTNFIQYEQRMDIFILHATNMILVVMINTSASGLVLSSTSLTTSFSLLASGLIPARSVSGASGKTNTKIENFSGKGLNYAIDIV